MKYAKYEMVLRKTKVHEIKKNYKANDPKDVIDFATKVIRMYEYPEEHFVAISVNNHLDIIGYTDVSIGTIDQTLANPREVFRTAIVQNASGIILAHNHPSGCCDPSPEDLATTKKMVKAGVLLGIPVLDHIVVGERDNACSLRELDGSVFDPQ